MTTVSNGTVSGKTKMDLSSAIGEKGRHTSTLSNSWVLLKRCLKLNFKSGEQITVAVVVPVVMMLLFGYVFGGMMEMGASSFINFIVPGIIIISIVQGATATAITVNNDVKRGIMNRFKSMPISRAAVLVSHAAAAMLRGTVSTTATIVAALFIGFTPEASFGQWVGAIAILLLFSFLMTWVGILVGLVVKDSESIGGIGFVLTLFPYLSSAFALTETLPRPLEIFANAQPLTPIADTIRGLFTGSTLGNELGLAIAWCVGLMLLAYLSAVQIFNKRLTK